MDRVVEPTDERRHRPGPEPVWAESFDLDFAASDGSLGGYLRMTVFPNLGRSWFWASLTGTGRRLVTVVEHDAPVPAMPGWELRASGLWSELIVETPLDHVSVGLEAFGVALETPADAYRSGWGDRVPLGLDLEWETAAPPLAVAPDDHLVGCAVHGEVLVADEVHEFDGWGTRRRRWGPLDLADPGVAALVGRLHDGTWLVVQEPPATSWVAPVGAPEWAPVAASIDTVADDDGLPLAATVGLDGAELVGSPIGAAPVAVEAPDGTGGRTRLARTLVGLHGRGVAGIGWLGSTHHGGAAG